MPEPTRPSDPAERVLAHIAVLGDPAQWETATTYESLTLALIDAVWSIGVRYTGVLNVLHRYRAARRGAGADPDRDTPADLVAFIGSCGGPDAFAAAVNNRQRTSSRNGILKADAVLRVAQVLVDAEVQTPEDLAAATPDQLAEVAPPLDGDPRTGLRPLMGLLPHAGGPPGRQGRPHGAALRRRRPRCRRARGLPARGAQALITGGRHATPGQPTSRLDYAIWLHQSGNKPA